MSSAQPPQYVVVKGFKLPSVFELAPESLSYEARPDDLFIVTYPKCGTTWTQLIVTRILNGGQMPDVFHEKGIFGASPYLEMNGKQAAIDAKRPCAIKTHLPYDLQPKHPTAKYIFVMRNFKDAAVSDYYMLKRVPGCGVENMDFHTFLPFLLRGEVAYGDYFDFVLSWWNQRNNLNILIVFYEDMKVDPAANILKIAEFLGEEYSKKLQADDGHILKQILQSTTFESTKEQLNKSQPDDWKDFYTRKGIIGDWKNHFTQEESQMVDQLFYQRLTGTGLEKMWDAYDIFASSPV